MIRMLEAGWHHEGHVPLVPDVGEGFFIGEIMGKDQTMAAKSSTIEQTKDATGKVAKPKQKQRVFSGIKPTNMPQLSLIHI